MRYAPLALLIAVSAGLNGCAARRSTSGHWQLFSVENGHILAPPVLPVEKVMQLAHARSVTSGGPECGIDSPEISLTWARTVARVNLRWKGVPEHVLVRGRNGPLDGMPEQDLSWWTRFGERLSAREHAGCLADGEAETLARRIAESLTLPSDTLNNLRYGDTARNGFLDMGPRLALKSISPLQDQRSFETVHYMLEPRGNGVRLAVRTIDHERNGKVRRVSHAEAPVIKIGNSACFVRYFFRTWRVSGNRRIALLAAARRDLLAPFTKRFEADPERFCASMLKSEGTCVAVPDSAVVTPEVKTHVNGQVMFIPFGGTIADILRAAKVRQLAAVLPSLTVQRVYNGVLYPIDFDRTRLEILRVVVVGGEDIRW